MSDDTPDAHVDNVEPSMEDILASIRRIIADEDVGAMAVSEDIASDNVILPSESFTALETDRAELGNDVLLHEDDAVSLAKQADAGENVDELSDMDLLLSDLDEDGATDVLDFETTDINELTELDTPSQTTSKLSGLGALAAAGLGAVATAGKTTAENLTEARRNPTPQTLLSDNNDEDTADEALDLLLDSDDLLSESDPQLDELLSIPESGEEEPEDDIEALLGDMLFEESLDDDDVSFTDEQVIDPAADMLADDDYSPDELNDELLADLLGDDDFDEDELPASTQSSDDLDLVKSLMADLTDDPYAVPDDMELSVEDAAVPDETDLVDDILSLSMEDEISLQSQGSAQFDAAESKSPDPFVIDMNDDLSAGVAPMEQAARSSLADIAQAADADAERIERRSGFAATGFAAAAGLMVATAGPGAASISADSVDNDNSTEETLHNEQEADDILAAMGADEVETETVVDALEDIAPEIETTPADDTPQTMIPTQETADMPKAAAKKDTIIDQVTEEATAGAFASLNHVVEEQAVQADRGDRIGDLVQEALRPMLKEWLDKNLKGIVERAVTKEVKRISSGK